LLDAFASNLKKNRNKVNSYSNNEAKTFSDADPGCLSQIPDPTIFHPGSRIGIFSILDLHKKNLSILAQKNGF
jgi:hypothetical protein